VPVRSACIGYTLLQLTVHCDGHRPDVVSADAIAGHTLVLPATVPGHVVYPHHLALGPDTCTPPPNFVLMVANMYSENKFSIA